MPAVPRPPEIRLAVEEPNKLESPAVPAALSKGLDVDAGVVAGVVGVVPVTEAGNNDAGKAAKVSPTLVGLGAVIV